MRKRARRSRRGVAIWLEIDGDAWHRVASLEDSGPDDRHFVLTTDENGTTTVRFGEGEHGAQLPAGTDRVVATYRFSKRFVVVVQQQGRVIVDKDWNENGPTGSRFYGVYRGVVTIQRGPGVPVAGAGADFRVVRKSSIMGNAVPAGGDIGVAGGGCERVGGLRGR